MLGDNAGENHDGEPTLGDDAGENHHDGEPPEVNLIILSSFFFFFSSPTTRLQRWREVAKRIFLGGFFWPRPSEIGGFYKKIDLDCNVSYGVLR